MLLSLSHMWWSQPGVRQQEKMPLPQDISPASPLHTTLFLLVTMEFINYVKMFLVLNPLRYLHPRI
ncbi:hypothetical protein EI555_010205 [Monodon monoceros]|uniref:Uncharacterized protein n=1 Tax=Monodon monoceros TaxID=40151 RepID=A0A4U1FCD6_MONMO|nr:hypothetical protein EI555_010205 [Monodon monoceros]